MPLISMSENGVAELPIQTKGTYSCTSLAITAEAQKNFISVDPGEVKLSPIQK